MNVLELFAGTGGMGVGFKKAGFNIVGAIELEKSIADSYEKNHPGSKIFCGDICKIDINNVKKELNAIVDVIVGGPPCQGFSKRGKNLGLDDERNFLFKEYFKYVKLFNPKYFVIENVPDIISVCDGVFIEMIKEEAKKHGYSINYGILNSKYFNVPQMRRRAIIIGYKEKEVTLPIQNEKAKIPTVWDAISDLAYLESGEGSFESEYKKPAESSYQEEMRKKSNKLYNHQATKHSEVAINRLKLIPPEKGKECLPKEELTKSTFGSTWGRLEKNNISPTIVTRFDTPSNGKNSHPFLNRAITPREAARIQSFPDNHIFYGNKSSVIKQIGNAVPPNLAYAIALQIKKAENNV